MDLLGPTTTILLVHIQREEGSMTGSKSGTPACASAVQTFSPKPSSDIPLYLFIWFLPQLSLPCRPKATTFTSNLPQIVPNPLFCYLNGLELVANYLWCSLHWCAISTIMAFIAVDHQTHCHKVPIAMDSMFLFLAYLAQSRDLSI